MPIAAVGFLYAFWNYSPPTDSLNVWNRELLLTGRFVPKPDTPYEPDAQSFVIGRAFDGPSGREIRELRGRDALLFSDFRPDADRIYEVLMRTSRDRTRLGPGFMGGNMLSGRIMTVTAGSDAPFPVFGRFDKFRAGLNTYVLNNFQREPAALISALTTGDTRHLGEDLRGAFTATGLVHILSISGSHFGLFSVMIFGIFRFLINRLPYQALQRFTIYLMPSQAAAILCIPFMAFYLGLSGASPPAVRSFVMITLFLSGLLIGRKGAWLNSLLFAAFILALRDPGVILDLSFQLSFLAVLFIGFSVEEEGHEENGRSRLYRLVKSPVKLTIAASAGTSVLSAYHFHYFSLISPLANLIVAPFIGFVLVPAALLSSFFFLATGHYLLFPLVSFAAKFSITLVRLFAKVPFAYLKIAAFPPAVCLFFYAGFLVYLLFGRRKTLLFVPFLPIFLYALVHLLEKRELTVTFIDVGQGDSEVIELPDRKTIVVDTGRTGRETAAYLKYRGKTEIDVLELTHADKDHAGGFGYLSERFRIGELWDNGLISYSGFPLPADHRPLERGDVIDASGCRITVIHPYRGFYTFSGVGEDNNSSLVTKVEGRRSSFLLTGDAADEAEWDMAHLGGWLKSDVIKMPHHGSRTSANEEFLRLVSPSVAVISAGRENAFGHPSPETLEMLSGRRILRTDRDGSVRMTETDRGLEITTYREHMLERAGGPEAELRNMRRLLATW